MIVCETERLRLCRFSDRDAAFILRLLNEPSFIEHIGDKAVRTLEDARSYLRDGPMASYERFGFGLNRVELTGSNTPIGMCGILKRASLDDTDLGNAFLPEYCGKGYASESAVAILDDARTTHGMRRVVAVVSPSNRPSIRLLEKLGFRYEKSVRLDGGESEETSLYGQDIG